MTKNKLITKNKGLRHPIYWNKPLIELSIVMNAVLVLLLILFFIGYRSGNSYQTKELSMIYANQCYNFDHYHASSYVKVAEAVLNGKQQTAYLIHLTQNQINSGCYSDVIKAVQIEYYQGLYAKYNAPLFIYLNPNGQSLDNIPQLNVFINSVK